jgi:hypothetical protein
MSMLSISATKKLAFAGNPNFAVSDAVKAVLEANKGKRVPLSVLGCLVLRKKGVTEGEAQLTTEAQVSALSEAQAKNYYRLPVLSTSAGEWRTLPKGKPSEVATMLESGKIEGIITLDEQFKSYKLDCETAQTTTSGI